MAATGLVAYKLAKYIVLGLKFPAFLDERNRLAMLADEMYLAMLEAGHAVRRHKMPGPLAHNMIDIVQKSLELWRWNEKTAMRFATWVLAGWLARPTSGRQRHLPEPMASACWRLIGLLEYLADPDGAR